MANDRKEKRRRRRSGLVSVFNGILTLFIFGILGAVGLFLYSANQFYRAGAVKEDATFAVDRGARMSTVASRLDDQGLIDVDFPLGNSLLFSRGAWALKKDSELKAGVFQLRAGYSMSDVLREITEGKPLDFYVHVIPGDTSFQVAERINSENPNLTGDPVTVPPEGSLLAIRYDYFPGDSRQSVLDKMQAEMQAKVAEIWAARDPSIDSVIRSPEEMVTLASIVEKETGVETERPEVAAVFLNRLKLGMRLQTDPTVLYGVTEGRAVLNRGPTSAELRAQNAYNTYQIDGLPPGPIANPGEAALRAVANPATTEALYFVAKSANPSDGHLFARTYAEHRQNVALYRRAAAEADAEAARRALEDEAAEEAGEVVTE
jgi:UPF0755 protein